MMKRMMGRTFNAPPQLPEGLPEWALRSPADSACPAPDAGPLRPGVAGTRRCVRAPPLIVTWAALIKKRWRRAAALFPNPPPRARLL